MNELTEQAITAALFKHGEDFEENKKPLRKVIDNAVIPAVGAAGAVAANAVKGLATLKYNEKLQVLK